MTRKRYRVRLEATAEASIEEERAWWEDRDPTRGDAIADELEKAIRFLARFAGAGALVQVRDRFAETARFLVLDRINCLLFYDIVEETREVVILLLWHEGRKPPKLKVRMQRRPKR